MGVGPREYQKWVGEHFLLDSSPATGDHFVAQEQQPATGRDFRDWSVSMIEENEHVSREIEGHVELMIILLTF